MTSIDFEKLYLSVKQKDGEKQIIKGVSGSFLSGELTAIMGPSGAGKTSLLNVLTGYQISGIQGTIRYGKATNNESSSLLSKRESCYILQDDCLPDLFTVQEAMMMACNLKTIDLFRKAKEYLIDDILNKLSLVKCRNTRCQHLSGGQKKRVSIALELVNNPPIMFLDEPTTGLDCLAGAQCVQLLKKLARTGKTIICTIHQPNARVYETFDHIYMMSNGKCVYQGASTKTVDFLAACGFQCPLYHNPADFIIEVVKGDYGDHTDLLSKIALEEKWSRTQSIKPCYESDEPCNTSLVYPLERIDCNKMPSEWTRFFVLLRRYRVQLYRDWTISQLKILLHLLVGLFLGLAYQNSGQDANKAVSNLGFFTVSTVYVVYTASMPAVLKFPSELCILKKEHFNNWYKVHTYFAAVVIFDLPLQVVFTSVYTITSYLLSNQIREWSRFGMMMLVQLLCGFAGSGFGLIIGSLFNPVNGTFVGIICLCCFFLFGGFFILLGHMSKIMYAITNLSFIGFTVEGTMQAIYGYDRPPLHCPEEVEFCLYVSPATLLKDIGMDRQNYWMDVAYLFSVVILFRIVAFFLLRRKLSVT
uniref:Putative ABCG protein n=1 Tax=Chrysomela populi TaxID=154003 RepID=A0A0U9HYG8_CHRPP